MITIQDHLNLIPGPEVISSGQGEPADLERRKNEGLQRRSFRLSASLGKADVAGEGRAKTAHQKSPACGRKAQITSSPGSVIGREQPRGNVGSA